MISLIMKVMILPAMFIALAMMELVSSANAAEVTVGELMNAHMSEDARQAIEAELKEQGIEKADVASVVIADAPKKDPAAGDDEDMIQTSDDSDSQITVTPPKDSKLTDEQLYFVGARIGLMVPFGVEATMLDMRDGKKVFHVAGAITTSLYMQTIEAGGGWHPGGKAFYIGMRLKDVMLHSVKEYGYSGMFDPNKTDMFFGISPEIGWLKVWGKKQNILGSFGLGMTKSFSANYNLPIMPDFRFGIAVKVSR